MTPDWLDERIHLGETPSVFLEKAKARLDSKEGRAAQAELSLSDAHTLERLPPERMAERIRLRRENKGIRGLFLWNSPGLSLLAVASLAFCAVMAPRVAQDVFAPAAPAAAEAAPRSTDKATATPGTQAPERQDRSPEGPAIVASAPVPDNGVRVRGGQELSIFAVSPDGTTRPSGASVQAGSVLRIATPLSSNAAVWSIDETGMIQRHWPVEGDSSASMAAGPLPRDWETDRSAGWDRFILVESPAPFALRSVEAHLRGLVASKRSRDARLSLPGHFETSSFLVERVAK